MQATGNSAADRENSKKQSELIRSWVRDSLGQCECVVPFEPASSRMTLFLEDTDHARAAILP